MPVQELFISLLSRAPFAIQASLMTVNHLYYMHHIAYSCYCYRQGTSCIAGFFGVENQGFARYVFSLCCSPVKNTKADLIGC